MKKKVAVLKLACTALLCGGLILACGTDDSVPSDPIPPIGQIDPVPDDTVVPPVVIDSINADTISDHLRFFDAVKIQGDIPKGPSGSSLQISFEDTLYLWNEVSMPIKFLHEDPAQDVAGVYLQVHIGGSAGIFYYDVPEMAQNAVNDSVSIILIGIDPKGLVEPDGVPPAGGAPIGITLTPYRPDGQPIATEDRPVLISMEQIDPIGGAGLCGLVLPPDEFWEWDYSWDLNTRTLYSPETVFGPGGQDILGCCENGVSHYTEACLKGDSSNLRTLHFPTSYQILSETFSFLENGTFIRNTFENTTNPVPDVSNFCGTGPGVVLDNIKHVNYEGNWTLNPLVHPFYSNINTFDLRLQGTASTGFGYGNPGGIINVLTCKYLILMQFSLSDSPDRFRPLYKFYERTSIDERHDRWFRFG